jgi:hypothetical protein
METVYLRVRKKLLYDMQKKVCGWGRGNDDAL